jgi:hypothetical protein
MLEPVEVKPLPQFRLYLRYAGGVEGEVDLSDLAGKGVFALWNEPGAFEKVTVSDHRSIFWTDQVELCADALYLQITGKTPEEVFPNLARVRVDA